MKYDDTLNKNCENNCWFIASGVAQYPKSTGCGEGKTDSPCFLESVDFTFFCLKVSFHII